MEKTPYWKTDDELFALIRTELYTAVVGDIMDRLGYFHQFLPPQIKPIHDAMFIAGRAMPVVETDTDVNTLANGRRPPEEKPFGLMLEALDDLKRNEVYICTGASFNYALWGELMSTRAMKLGAAGAVVDGYSRDTRGILSMNFPTFSRGSYAQDQAPRGKVIDFRVPVTIAEVKVRPGDMVIGDLDGVCIVPLELETEVFSLALEKARGEKVVQHKLEEGMSSSDAFKKYGIL